MNGAKTKIKLNVPMATKDRVFAPGVVDWDADDAKRLIKAGYAEPLADDKPAAAEPAGHSKK